MFTTHKQRGMYSIFLGLFIAIGFPLFGIITSTNGLYGAMIFVTSYLLALLCVGPFIYRSAKRDFGKVPENTKPPKWFLSLFIFISMVSFPIFHLFFQSNFFVSSFGQHAFLICMGSGTSVFIPMGVGMLDAKPTSVATCFPKE